MTRKKYAMINKRAILIRLKIKTICLTKTFF